MATKKKADEAKFHELILYVSLQSEGDEWFGVSKLNKLLYFIDVESLREFGSSLTGQEYVKRAGGPVPAKLDEALETLRDTNALVIRPRLVAPYRQRRPFAMREPKWDLFDPRELILVESVIRQFKGWTALQCSAFSHERSGWRLADVGEVIPIGAALISDRDLTEEEKAYAKDLAGDPEFQEFTLARDA